MRLYIHSTVPWSPSSYSVLVSRTVPNIVRDGHKVTLGVWYGLQGQPLPWSITDKDGKPVDSVTVLPAADERNYGIGTMIPSYKHFKADVLITISDVWVFPGDQTRHANFCPWLPIDHDPAPQPVVDALGTAVYPMIMSQFGVDVLRDKHNIESHYVPCSAPASVFKPGDKDEARKALGFPADADFIVAVVSANKDPLDRKGLVEDLQGFARFAESHPQAYLYLHTNWSGNIQIRDLIQRLGVKSRVIQPDPYAMAMGMLDERYMANVYRASDVLLNACKSEGFGLPIVEAQMCGCPAAVTDFATTDEILFAGWKLQGELDWSNGLNSWRKRVYIDEIVGALEEAYQNRDKRKLAKKARNGAMRYDNDTIFNQYWRPALADMERLTAKTHFTIPAELKEVAVP